MFSELLKRCLLGDRIAGTQLYLQIALHDCLEKSFKRMGLDPKLVLLPAPQPGPPSFEMGKAWSERALIRSLESIRHMEQPFIDQELRKKALQQLHKEFQFTLLELEKEIKKLDATSG